MKAITLIQPWATLIALGEKQFETRGWSTDHRGQLAIHAGKKIDFEACEFPGIKATLAKHGIRDPRDLPTGSVIAICSIFDCVKMAESRDIRFNASVPGYKLTPKEYAFGEYAPGRFAWILASLKKLNQPIPVKGAQRLWEWDGKLNS